MNSNNNDNNEDKNLFRSFVNDVTPIDTHTIEPVQNKPKARVKKQVIESLTAPSTHKIQQHESDSYFAFHVSKIERKSIKAGKTSFDATLDLHGNTVAQSKRLLVQFINDCQLQHIKHAIIVHGQGHNSEHGSVLKPAVLHWLSQQTAIDGYCPAQLRDGGQGASYILIKGSSQ